ncbi:Hypp7526 [Branchiostoma lanceolatum]|uniref:Hypp7526 protein n=1 Tax=Branchiostoma lanceolatum TaxID=7740 RepID=A0A8J9Z232_BRALA|nr:Hypp7526 [Branchiostoma lanceolatum]
MPGKKKGKGKKGKGKKGKKGKKKDKNSALRGEPGAAVKSVLRAYDENCARTASLSCVGLRRKLKASYEDNILLEKFLLEGYEDSPPDQPIMMVEPLLDALRSERYVFIKELSVWDVPLKHENVASVALLLEKQVYPLRQLELLDCGIESYPVTRLARSFPAHPFLSTIILDYNDNLFLDGNDLECEGAMELIKMVADTAEREAFERAEEVRMKAELEAEKELEGKKKKKEAEPPKVGPWLKKLHLAENGLDAFGKAGNYAPVICMRLFRKLITNSNCLEELDLGDNHIGDLGGRELLQALLDRKEAKLPTLSLGVSPMMHQDTFTLLMKHSGSLKKKGKKKKGKGKGKKKKKK